VPPADRGGSGRSSRGSDGRPFFEVAKTTVNHLYSVISGKARVKIEGGADETLAVGDVMTVPCWHAHTLTADEDAVLLRVTDEPLLAKVGLVKTG
jgi:gentisate 1,2-dioxygenase